MEQKNFFQSKNFSKILITIGGVIVVLLVFQAGVFVGFKKAAFSYRLGESYYRAFGPMHGGPMGGVFNDDFSPPNGVIGKIIKVSLPTITIDGRDNIEKVVTIGDETAVRYMRGALAPNALAVGNYVVVIGAPTSSGQIAAELIRVIPPPMINATTSSNY
jgi:hypothetical protein